MTQEFWGPSRGWAGRDDTGRIERRPALEPSDDTTGAMRALRDGVTAFRPQRLDRRDPSGSIARTRVHGAGPDAPASPATRDASLGELAGGRPRRHEVADDAIASHDAFDWDFDADDHVAAFRDEIPLTPTPARASRLGLGAVDPLLARLGALAVVGVLLVPVALALRPSDSAAQTVRSDVPAAELESVGSGAQAPETGLPDLATTAPAATGAPTVAGDAATSTSATAAPASNGEAASVATAGTSVSEQADELAASPLDDVAQSEPAEQSTAIDDAATADVTAERIIPDCSNTYAATSGDSWYAIADAADVSPSALMSQNSATADTVILPGDTVCLPAGASVVRSTPASTSAPATTNAPSTNAPATTSAPATKAPTTNAPATTSPPTTVAPAKTAGPASVEQVKQMIRDTWPADQHEMAFFIANRESGFDPRADNNFCCYGVFQIYFEVHKGWLDDFGVHTASDLFDAEKNIAAAYRIYQRSGGWGPWGY
ncbi:MAG: LysM peptidoglycan-binding domain-containing protein [Ilumatobacteraceae bacterium]